MPRAPWFALLLTVAFLSGCAQDDAQTGTTSASIAPTTSAPPAPVAIHDTVDLTSGAQGTHWNFTVATGLTDGHLRVVLQGLQGQTVRGTGQYCLEWQVAAATTTNGTEGSCGSGNVVVQNPSATGEQVLLDWDASHLGPGAYTLKFSAAPQAAQLVVDAVATY